MKHYSYLRVESSTLLSILELKPKHILERPIRPQKPSLRRRIEPSRNPLVRTLSGVEFSRARRRLRQARSSSSAYNVT